MAGGGSSDPLERARALARAGRAEEALAVLGAAWAKEPYRVELVDAIADLHTVECLVPAMLAARRAAFSIMPTATRRSALAAASISASHFDQARVLAAEALAEQPSLYEARQVLALAALHEGRVDEAVEQMRQVVAQAPGEPSTLINFGKALWMAGDAAGADAQYRAALALPNPSPDAHYSLALLRLTQGRLEEGWEHYLRRRVPGRREPPRHRLAGRLAGKRYVIDGEQGLGDELFLLRFAVELAGRGAEIAWRTRTPKALPLLQRLPFLAEAFDVDGKGRGEALAGGDLPWLLGSTRPLPPVPIEPLPERLMAMRARLEAFGPPPWVGVTWRAGTTLFNAQSKAAPAGGLAHILGGIDARVVVLQRQPAAGEVEAFALALGRGVLDASAFNDDLEDMLALLALLDDHVAVSNANVHLSASLGRPARVLVCWPPDFRWGMEGGASDWYPGMRAYRQAPGEDWLEPLTRLARDMGGPPPDRGPHLTVSGGGGGGGEPSSQPPLDQRLQDAARLNGRGQAAEAETLCRHVLADQPDHPGALLLLASILLNLGRMEEAASCLERSAELAPGFEVHRMHARALAGLGRWAEAVRALDKALAIQPGATGERGRLAAALLESGHPEAALAQARLAAEGTPGDTFSALVTEGAAQMVLGKARDARHAFELALALAPSDPTALDNHALASYALGDYEAADESWNRAMAVAPDNPRPRGNLALMQLALGRFAEGWSNYRIRDCAVGRPGPPAHRLPADLSEYVLLVESEQGLGDELFLLRFVERLAARGRPVLYRANPKLASMLGRVSFIERIVPPGEEVDVSARLWPGDLPWLLDEPGPLAPVRLEPLPARVDEMRARLAAFGPPPYVGVAWRAGVASFNKLFKEVAPAALAAALAAEPGSLVVLQRAPKQGEVEDFTRALGRPALDLSALNEDLEGMLALLSLLDDTVTVSSANVHLLASLGRPARILLPHPPEFRWMAEGEVSPWFPSMRLYRQDVRMGWGPALERLSATR